MTYIDIAIAEEPDTFDVWVRASRDEPWQDLPGLTNTEVFDLLGSVPSEPEPVVSLLWTSAPITMDMALDLFD